MHSGLGLFSDRTRQVHVQFFGDEGERGWLFESSAIRYEGKEAFEQFCKVMQEKDKRNKKIYSITGHRRKAWEVAVRSAEQALPMSKAERQQLFAPMPEPVEAESAETVKKRRASKEAPQPPASKKTKRSLTSPMENQSMAQFTVFCMRRRDAVKREHPGYTPQQVDELLQAQWNTLDADQKSLFIPMGQDFANLSKHMPAVQTGPCSCSQV